VVIPARDAAATIGDQLDALAAQTFDGSWEVIVVDDGSSDGTALVAGRWADKLPSLRVLSTEWRGKSCALNQGTIAARGRLLAYCDADDVVSPSWLSGIVGALRDHEVATGPIDLSLLNPRRLYAWRRAPGWQQLPRWMAFLQPVMGCNMAVRRETFDLVGGFDTSFERGQDFDFAWRIQLTGATVGFAPEAVVHWRLAQGWSYLSRSFHYGAYDVELYRRFRDRGLRRRPLVGVFRLAGMLLGVPIVLVPRYRYAWMHLAGVELGRVKGSVVARTLYL